MDKRYQIFVSSTFTDLKDERQKVMHTLMALDCIPAGMELFPAADEEQWHFIKRVIDDCDYYLLIIGGRYGTLTQEGISYTEKEYDYAVERGLKVIVLIHGAPDQIPAGKTEVDPKAREKLAEFRKKVSTGRLVSFWKTLEELSGLVALSLTKTFKMYPAVGWVRANALANNVALSELNDLRKRNMELEQQLSKFQEASSSHVLYAGKPYEDLARALSKRAVTLDFADKPMNTHLLQALESYESQLILGVDSTPAVGLSGIIFHRVAAPLMIFGLTDFMPVPTDAQWQRLGLNETGRRFMAEMHARRS